MAEYIDLNNTEVLAEAGENAKLVVEENGELKRIPASAVGQVKTVNGVEPDMKGNVKVSYDDLLGKPFYETLAYGSESYGTDGFESVDVGGVYRKEDAFSISLDASKQYTVEQYPGYVCEVKTTQGMKYIGNTAIIGFGEDTGEPFIIVENPDTGMAIVVLKEAPASKLFFVRDVVETIKPLDPKFLPEGVCGKLFYYNDNNRLCHDAQCTKEVTYDEGVAAMNAGVIRISNPRGDTIRIALMAYRYGTGIQFVCLDDTVYYIGEESTEG